MSGMLFRASPTEHALRSVGDPPNGVVGLRVVRRGGEPAVEVTVSSSLEPAKTPEPILVTKDAQELDPLNETEIDLQVLIDGLANSDAANALWRITAHSAQTAVQLGFEQMIGLDHARAVLDFAERVNEAFHERRELFE